MHSNLHFKIQSGLSISICCLYEVLMTAAKQIPEVYLLNFMIIIGNAVMVGGLGNLHF